MKTKNPIFRGLAAAVILGLTAPLATATLLIYEGFDYTTPSNLRYSGTGEIIDNDEDGAINLTNVNSVIRTADWMSGNMVGVTAGSLSYTDSNGVSVQTSGGKGTLFNARGIRYNTNTYAATGGTIYGSYLWQTPNLNDTDEWRGFFEIRNPSGLNARIGLGLNNDFTDTNLQVRYGGTTNTTTLGLDQATTYFIVFKAEYNASGQMTSLNLWLNPGDLTSEAGSGAATLSYTGNIGGGGFAGFAIQKDNLPGGHNPTFDEIRIGTTWDAVAIPEPGTLLLVGIALGSLAIFRRRR